MTETSIKYDVDKCDIYDLYVARYNIHKLRGIVDPVYTLNVLKRFFSIYKGEQYGD